jgi:hypothetical protein
VLLKLDFDICIWNTDFDQRVRGRVVTSCCRKFVLICCLAVFAEIEVWTNCAFVSDTTNTSFDTGAAVAVAMDMAMLQGLRNETLNCVWKMFVDCSKCMTRMDRRRILDAVVAEIIIATFETFVSDTNNVLQLEWLEI